MRQYGTAKYPEPDEPDTPPDREPPETPESTHETIEQPSLEDKACIRKPSRPMKPACRRIRKQGAVPIIALPRITVEETPAADTRHAGEDRGSPGT